MITKFARHLHRNFTEYQDGWILQKRVVYREQSKGPNTLPCGTPYSNKLGCDLSLEVATVSDRPERNEDNKFKAVDEKPNQFCKR